MAALDSRREAILKSLEEREPLTGQVHAIDAAVTMTSLEDIYLPHRPKTRTRNHSQGKSLARLLFAQDILTDPLKEAVAYINSGQSVESVEEALAGARDICPNGQMKILKPGRTSTVEQGRVSCSQSW